MKNIDQKIYHKLYGVKKPRINYQKKDFIDYVFMIFISVLIIYISYGFDHLLFKVGIFLCAIMIATFSVRHGVAIRMPIIFRRPHDVLYMIIYKIQNMKPMYILAVIILFLENLLIHLTPNLPHNVELVRKISLYLFYFHFIAITAYRTAILIAHLKNKNHVKEVLLQTSWRNFILKQRSISREIWHAYFTGILTHMILIAPWYIVITYFNFSIIFLPVICVINVVVHLKYIKSYPAWFYRDHWLGHNSEFDFIYLHGPHHDAIPSGLIGVSGNGYIEGFLRHTLGNPTPFYNPVVAFLLYSIEIYQDIRFHQYIPGVFPRLPRYFHETSQHSTHHFGKLEPYGIGLKLNQSKDAPETEGKAGVFPEIVLNSISFDEKLTGFEWDNQSYRKFMELYDKYSS